jgi:hypothetical protein
MKQATKQMLKSAAFESSFVVLGVVLALAANEWRNDYQIRQETLKTLESIHRELAENRKLVAQSQDYHQSKLLKLNKLESEPDIREFEKGFISPARISDVAWRAASETGALKNVAYEELLNLSKLYKAQSDYVYQSKNIGNIIYQKLFDGGHQAMLGNYKNLSMIIATMSYREYELLQLYDSALPELNQKPE